MHEYDRAGLDTAPTLSPLYSFSYYTIEPARFKVSRDQCDIGTIQTAKNAIYSALWDMSRRAEVTIVVRDEGGGEMVEFVPWQGGVRG